MGSSRPADQPSPAGQGGLGRRVAVNAGILSAFNALGVVAALAVDMLVAAVFGIGTATDAFYLAYTVPQFIGYVLAGSFTSTLIPVFIGAEQTGGLPLLWRRFRLLLWLVSLFLVLLTGLGLVLAAPLVRVVGSGAAAAELAQAAAMSRILFLLVPSLGLIEVMRAVLLARGRYVISSAGNIVNLVALFVIVLLGTRGRIDIVTVAWAYLAGAVLQTVFLAGGVIASGGSLAPAWAPRDPGLIEALKLVLQRMGGVALRRSGMIFERFVASFLPPGSLTALTYAQRVSLSLWQVFADSVSTAVLPDQAAAAQQGLNARVREGLSISFKLLSYVIWPAAAGLAVLAVPVIRVLFQRGAFDAAATAQTADLLRIYAFSIPALALLQIFLAPFYAGKDARTPTIHMAIVLVVNLVLVALLTWLFGAVGLALGYMLAAVFSLGRGYLIAQRLLGSLRELRLLHYTGQVAIACLVMAAAVWGGWELLRLAGWRPAGSVGVAAQLAVLGALGAAIYIVATHLLGMRELGRVVDLTRHRLAAGGRRARA